MAAVELCDEILRLIDDVLADEPESQVRPPQPDEVQLPFGSPHFDVPKRPA